VLNVVIINLEMALHDAGSSPEIRSRINNAFTAVNRVVELTRQMLSYSGRGSFLVERLDLGELVIEQHRALLAGVPRTIRLELHCEERLPAWKPTRTS